MNRLSDEVDQPKDYNDLAQTIKEIIERSESLTWELRQEFAPKSTLGDMLMAQDHNPLNKQIKFDWRPPIGTRVLITGNHPHAGKTGTVYRHDGNVFNTPLVGMAVKCDDGLNAGVLKPEDFEVLTNS